MSDKIILELTVEELAILATGFSLAYHYGATPLIAGTKSITKVEDFLKFGKRISQILEDHGYEAKPNDLLPFPIYFNVFKKSQNVLKESQKAEDETSKDTKDIVSDMIANLKARASSFFLKK